MALETIKTAIDGADSVLKHVSNQLWSNPELLFEEYESCKLLTSKLEDYGFKVERQYHLPTAFRAEFSNGDGPVICFICEYDALPEIGQACGHNLIAECGLGAAIGIKTALEKGLLKGKVVCLGTPAEENGGGGKVTLVANGAMKDVDFCIMAHPGPHTQNFPIILAIERYSVKYFGKASHASAAPWDGINALDAAVALYNNVSMMRQQMKSDWRIHGVIIKGGTVPNVIPAMTELSFYIRTRVQSDIELLRQKLYCCVEAAAKSTGCSYECKREFNPYKTLVTNSIMADMFKKHCIELGNFTFSDDDDSVQQFTASTDMGDISHEVPSIHPIFYMGTRAANHTIEFAEAAGKPEAQPYTVVVAKSMALTAAEVMMSPQLQKDIKEEFANASK